MTDTRILRCVSPIDGSLVAERPLASSAEAVAAIARARAAQAAWRRVPLAQRMATCAAFAEIMAADKARLGADLTRQMGRPIRYTPNEIGGGLVERTRKMVELAPDALADLPASEKSGFTRFIRKDPLGVVFVIAPWNYPYLTAVNAIVPALIAGNAVILKHSHQTPLVAEAFRDGLAKAGLPDGVFQVLHLGHADTEMLVASEGVDFVAFTGSVPGGHAVTRAAKDRFIGLGLELGGKDPAYVRADCDLAHAIENLVDGAFFNSGQSCCGIERIYVHADVYERFVDGFVDLTRTYVLGDPTNPDTTLGPMVRASAADFVRGQIADAIAAGARSLVDPKSFAADAPGTPYLAPHVLVGVTHAMRVMTEESFGPVIGIMKVGSDDEAVSLMNDSAYGLTAAIWTSDADAAIAIGDRVATGTWFMNRCDYLDPELAWTGVKDSGRGCTLSRLGFDYLTRPKSFHLRTATA
jgi:acyl-CoA reductase-like NAD-dependent aldehyde dehydrogenase